MTKSRGERLVRKLRALFDAIADEAAVNPAFALKVEAVFMPDPSPAEPRLGDRLDRALPEVPPANTRKPRSLLKTARTQFDPLELHLEAAILSGNETEARAFLGRLNRTQLEEVVKAQRLPGARALQKTISEASDPASAVDAIVGSASEKVRGRHLAAG